MGGRDHAHFFTTLPIVQGMKRYTALLLLLLLGACNTPPPGIAPTLTLVPAATATLTLTPAPPTATPPPRINPDDLQASPTPQSAIIVPDNAAVLVERAADDLAAVLGTPASALALVELSAATWYTADFGCGEIPYTGDDTIEIDGYRLVFEVDGVLYAYHTDDGETVRRCARADVVVGERRTIIEADPVAAELVALARRRVTALAAVTADNVTVVSVRPYRWRDTSLGCPLPDETYTALDVDGYRIVLAADGSEYVFHTSFTDLKRCAAGNEVLP